MKHMGDDGDLEVLKKVEGIHTMLREKEGDLEDLEALNQTLIVKERKSNDELQDARKELISVSLLYYFYFFILVVVPFPKVYLTNRRNAKNGCRAQNANSALHFYCSSLVPIAIINSLTESCQI